MANSLLDFVISLVRDPEAAARYAADPAQAITDAHLTDVTSVDVDNLIPMVSESLSMAAPAPGGDAAADGNVWASGAATAAFDAFSPRGLDAAVADPQGPGAEVIDQSLDDSAASPTESHPSGIETFDPSLQFGGAEQDYAAVDDTGFVPEDQPDVLGDWDDHRGFDIFE